MAARDNPFTFIDDFAHRTKLSTQSLGGDRPFQMQLRSPRQRIFQTASYCPADRMLRRGLCVRAQPCADPHYDSLSRYGSIRRVLRPAAAEPPSRTVRFREIDPGRPIREAIPAEPPCQGGAPALPRPRQIRSAGAERIQVPGSYHRAESAYPHQGEKTANNPACPGSPWPLDKVIRTRPGSQYRERAPAPPVPVTVGSEGRCCRILPARADGSFASDQLLLASDASASKPLCQSCLATARGSILRACHQRRSSPTPCSSR